MAETRGPVDRIDLPKSWEQQDWQLDFAKPQQLFEPKSPIDQDRLFVGRALLRKCDERFTL
jgi:hypothetical protein